MEEVHVLMPIIGLLLIGILAIAIMRKLRLSPIIGYLLAGILIGPHALGWIDESETTHLLAELGVVFLLFDIGLHFSLSSIWEARRDILGLGPLQMILCGLGFGGIALVLGFSLEMAIILGGAFALSSTAVVVQTLSERRQRNCPVGLTGTAILIFQDICAILILILAASMEGGEAAAGGGIGEALMLAIGKAVIAFIASVLIGRYLIDPLFRLLSQTRNEEVFTATALLVILAAAAATGEAGLSLTLGAFLGGMIISETPFRQVIQTEAKPFRNLLLGFFFITVGMSLDWHVLIGSWAEILLFLVALILVKVIMTSIAARLFGWTVPGSLQLSFLLAQGSEFVFVILAMPVVREAMGENAFGVLITGTAASLALTPAIAQLGNRLARLYRRRFSVSLPASETQARGHLAPVVVFGMGEIGRTVVDALKANDIAYEAIEMDYERFLSASADGYSVLFGDLADTRLMETLALGDRNAIVVTIVRYEISEALKPIMQTRYPELIRFIPVEDEDEKTRFEAVGMHAVVNRSFPRGLDLAAEVLRAQDIEWEKIQSWMQRQQERALPAEDLVLEV
ncbi:cation:proton antiporter domain-containing protein [Flavilitoribacter nigricans]|uniref:Potassium transporter KefB n=1 Tax=Flavilitoribacter nigricans (strain ATCC 23147 / DSM 23189 / NBRC 102662 / NCIMB 1420 / SS-2) TaxID=1122177 RepID=A0A2D0NIA5_FLAN2|nr:cation:proton antiporter [Flavilitoribacter nigricans]PHN08235.1 potassium transporter KefB [Flavilitoribacter nigricans DSM 23189 = NBRC 102662]